MVTVGAEPHGLKSADDYWRCHFLPQFTAACFDGAAKVQSPSDRAENMITDTNALKLLINEIIEESPPILSLKSDVADLKSDVACFKSDIKARDL